MMLDVVEPFSDLTGQKTQFGPGGYGVRPYGSFAGKTPFVPPTGQLFRIAELNGLSAGGPFFSNPLG